MGETARLNWLRVGTRHDMVVFVQARSQFGQSFRLPDPMLPQVLHDQCGERNGVVIAGGCRTEYVSCQRRLVVTFGTSACFCRHLGPGPRM
jgi:hypothetical protein